MVKFLGQQTIVFKSIKTKTLSNIAPDKSQKNIQEEFFYYYAVRTSHIGFEDQLTVQIILKLFLVLSNQVAWK